MSSHRAKLRPSVNIWEVCPECQTKLAQIEEISIETAPRLDRGPSYADASARSRLRVALATLGQSHAPAGINTPLQFARSIALLSAAAVLIALSIGIASRRPRHTTQSYAGLLPDPAFTPGSTRPVKLSDLCSSSEDVVREVPASLRQEVFSEYGLRNATATEFEVDYLITPGLGGSDDVRNLWPEPHHTATWNSYVKDQLEDRLHLMVCGNRLSLVEAQTAIATDWIAAYKKYFHTDQPLSSPTLARVHRGADKRRSIASQASFTASSRVRASFTSAARSAKLGSSSNRLSAAAAIWDE